MDAICPFCRVKQAAPATYPTAGLHLPQLPPSDPGPNRPAGPG